MKKNIALLSLLIVFSFVTVSFGQDEIDFGRTTPVISHTGSHGNRDHDKQIIWKAVYVNQKTVIIKIMKTIDCANLLNITAFDENDQLIPINKIDKIQFKKLNISTKESIIIEFKEPISENTKIKFKLEWDLKKCGDTNISSENNSAKTIAPSSKTSEPSLNYNSEDYFYFQVKKIKGKVKDVKMQDSPKNE
jgi:hypothetical protein